MHRQTKKCVIQPVNAVAMAVPVAVSMGDQSILEVECWQGNGLTGAPNIWIFEGRLTLVECQNRLASSDFMVDGMCLGDNEVTKFPLDESSRVVTVFFEATNGTTQSQSANLVFHEFTADRFG